MLLTHAPDSPLPFNVIWGLLAICSLLFGTVAVSASGGDTMFIEAEAIRPSSDAWIKTTHDQPEATIASEPFAAKVADLKIGTLPVNRILFLGNSITLHGPAPQIGWTGNWGMAASSEDKDYVHVLLSRITEASGGKPQIMVKNVADFERRLTDYNLQEELKQELAFNADVIIIALGENAASPTTDESKAQFASAFAKLFAELKSHGQPTLFVRSQFWQDAVKDELLKKACDDANGIFIDISKLGTDPNNFARAERQIEHPGVAGHPGDKGMQQLAGALWDAIQKQGTPSH